MYWISPLTYALSADLVSFILFLSQRALTILSQLIEFSETKAGEIWLKLLDVQVTDLWTNVYVVLGFALFFRACGYLALKYRYG